MDWENFHENAQIAEAKVVYAEWLLKMQGGC